MIDQEKLDGIMHVMNPVISFAMIVAILNLAAPLDYHLIFLAQESIRPVYIAAPGCWKISGRLVRRPRHPTPRKQSSSTWASPCCPTQAFPWSLLASPCPCWRKRSGRAALIQGTIAAAAVINEIIAVFMAKKGFEWAGELGKAHDGAAPSEGAVSV